MCSVYNPICDVQNVLSTVGSKIAGSVFAMVTQAFADAANQLTQWMWTVIAATTQVNLSGGWFRSTLGITMTLAGLVILTLFVLELIKGVLQREAASIGRAAVGIGAGTLGAFASLGAVTVLLSTTDALSDGIVRTTGLGAIGKLGAEIAPTAGLNTIGAPALVLLLGLGYLVASFFVWALFIARKAMLIVAAVFAPIAFAGAPMRATTGWVRKWIEFTIALIFSKLIIVILFTLAISLVGSPGAGFAAVGNLFSGLAILVIACFAPWLLFRLVHFVDGDLMHAHHQSLTSGAVRAGAAPAAMAVSGARQLAGVISGRNEVGAVVASTHGGAAEPSTPAGAYAANWRQIGASGNPGNGSRPPSTTAANQSPPHDPPALPPPAPPAGGTEERRDDPPPGDRA